MTNSITVCNVLCICFFIMKQPYMIYCICIVLHSWFSVTALCPDFKLCQDKYFIAAQGDQDFSKSKFDLGGDHLGNLDDTYHTIENYFRNVKYCGFQ